MVAWLGPAISAAGSLLGGIMGNRAAEKQNTQQMRAIERANKQAMQREDTRIQRIVEDARAAGIHPLAALGSSAVGNMAVPQAVFGGQPISGDVVSDAAGYIGQAVSKSSGTENLQEQLLRAQIRNVDASTQRMLADAQGTTLARNARAEGQTLYVDGKPVQFPAGYSPSQIWEDYLGEVGDWASAAFAGPEMLEKEFLAPLSAELTAGVKRRFYELLEGLKRKGQ